MKTSYALTSVALASLLAACGGGSDTPAAAAAAVPTAKDPGTTIALGTAKACTDQTTYTLVGNDGSSKTIEFKAGDKYDLGAGDQNFTCDAADAATVKYTLAGNSNETLIVDKTTGLVLPTSTLESKAYFGTDQKFDALTDAAIAKRVYHYQIAKGGEVGIFKISDDGTKMALCKSGLVPHATTEGKCVNTTTNALTDAETFTLAVNANAIDVKTTAAGNAVKYTFYKISTDLGDKRSALLVKTADNNVAFAVTANDVADSNLKEQAFGAPIIKSPDNCADLANVTDYEHKAAKAFTFTRAAGNIDGTWTLNAGKVPGTLSVSNNANFDLTGLPVTKRVGMFNISCKTGSNANKVDYFVFAK